MHSIHAYSVTNTHAHASRDERLRVAATYAEGASKALRLPGCESEHVYIHNAARFQKACPHTPRMAFFFGDA
jgi:hypothetical protein